MKRFVIVLSLLLLVVACVSTVNTVKSVADADSRVQSFLQLFPNATYSQSSFSVKDAASMRDVVAQDCGNTTLPEAFVRATYATKVATLVAYVADDEVICTVSKLNQDAFTIEKGDPSTVENGTLITVNGHPITLADLQSAYALLPAATRNQTAPAAILNQLVDQQLLLQAASTVEVNDLAVAKAAEVTWKNAGFANEQAFRAALTKQGGSYNSFLSSVRDQLRVQRYLAEHNVTTVNVSEEAARQYYLENTNSFLVGEQVRFRQLFIGFNQSGGQEEARARLQTVLQALQGGIDFCDAVKRYSDDVDSKERCGEYTAPRGVLLPSLETAIFSLRENQSTVVQGPNGYHIVVLLQHQPAAVVPYAQAASQVKGLLRGVVAQQRLSILLLKLRADATIVDYT